MAAFSSVRFVTRIELDEAGSYVGKKQRCVKPHEADEKGDHYVFLAMAGTQKAIISYRIGKRDEPNTTAFVRDLRERIINAPDFQRRLGLLSGGDP